MERVKPSGQEVPIPATYPKLWEGVTGPHSTCTTLALQSVISSQPRPRQTSVRACPSYPQGTPPRRENLSAPWMASSVRHSRRPSRPLPGAFHFLQQPGSSVSSPLTPSADPYPHPRTFLTFLLCSSHHHACWLVCSISSL